MLLAGFELATIRLEDGGPFLWDFRSVEHGAGVEPALTLLQSVAWPLGDPCDTGATLDFMAITPMILNVRISAPTSSEVGENLWRVDIDQGVSSRDGKPASGGLLAICDTEREAQAFVAALGLDGLLGRMAEHLRVAQ